MNLNLFFYNPRLISIGNEKRLESGLKIICRLESELRVIEEFQKFSSPLGPHQINEIQWYIEEYVKWPYGPFSNRAQKIEGKLEVWGHLLFKAIFNSDATINFWKELVENWDLIKISIEIDPKSLFNQTDSKNALIAANGLFALPWEILHDGENFLIQGEKEIRILRNVGAIGKISNIQFPIRTLLISPRPEIAKRGTPISLIDTRVTAIPLIELAEELGEELIKVDILDPPTFPGMVNALELAKRSNFPYSIVHFDGHGTIDPESWQGALCFEDPEDYDGITNRRSVNVLAKTFAHALSGYDIPLVFLEACQTAQSIQDPKSSVAVSLLISGIGSVIAMSHSVLVKTTQNFVNSFYKKLIEGASVSDAMTSSQKVLYRDKTRNRKSLSQFLNMNDWFVPVLYQNSEDPSIFSAFETPSSNSDPVSETKSKELNSRFFYGRNQGLLYLERMLKKYRAAHLSGIAGIGKTTLAIEIGDWLLRKEDLQKVVYIDLSDEIEVDFNEIVERLWKSCFSVGDNAFYPEDPNGKLKLLRNLQIAPNLLVIIDSIELLFPPVIDFSIYDHTYLAGTQFYQVFKLLWEGLPTTSFLFVSRFRFDLPFLPKQANLRLGALEKFAANKIVENLIRQSVNAKDLEKADILSEINNLDTILAGHPLLLIQLAKFLAPETQIQYPDLRKRILEFEANQDKIKGRSIFEEIEKSFYRLPKKFRDDSLKLACTIGGANIFLIIAITSLTSEEAVDLSMALQYVGLATYEKNKYLKLHPALPPFLQKFHSERSIQKLKIDWMNCLIQSTEDIYSIAKKGKEAVSELLENEVPNYWWLLDSLGGLWEAKNESINPEGFMRLLRIIEDLFSGLKQPQLLQKVSSLKEIAVNISRDVNESFILSEFQAIKSCINSGRITDAEKKCVDLITLLENSQNDSVTYHLRGAYSTYSQVLVKLGHYDQAIKIIVQELSFIDDTQPQSVDMQIHLLTSKRYSESALGRDQEAKETALRLFNLCIASSNDLLKAHGLIEMSKVCLIQMELSDAIFYVLEAIGIYKNFGKPIYEGNAWHHLADIYHEQENFQAEEKAYLEAIKVVSGTTNVQGLATCYANLGVLYYQFLGRLNDGITFLRYAEDEYKRINSYLDTWIVKQNIGNILLMLGKLLDAKREIQDAIYLAQNKNVTWKIYQSYDVLSEIEQKLNNQEGFIIAWKNARDYYYSYRINGGSSETNLGIQCEQWYRVVHQHGKQSLIDDLEIKKSTEMSKFGTYLITILKGKWDESLIEDYDLKYWEAAELYLFQNRLMRM